MGESNFILRLEFKNPQTNLLTQIHFGPFDSDSEAEQWAESVSMNVNWYTKVPLYI